MSDRSKSPWAGLSTRAPSTSTWTLFGAAPRMRAVVSLPSPPALWICTPGTARSTSPTFVYRLRAISSPGITVMALGTSETGVSILVPIWTMGSMLLGHRFFGGCFLGRRRRRPGRRPRRSAMPGKTGLGPWDPLLLPRKVWRWRPGQVSWLVDPHRRPAFPGSSPVAPSRAWVAAIHLQWRDRARFAPRAPRRAHLLCWAPRPGAQRTGSTPRARLSGPASQLDPSRRPGCARASLDPGHASSVSRRSAR